MMYPS